jgi:hypothetical protein
MTDTPITDEMVEAGARAMTKLRFERGVRWFNGEASKPTRDIDLENARACLEAAMAVQNTKGK